LLSNDTHAQSLGIKARETANRFTVASMIREYEDLYQGVLRPARPRQRARDPALATTRD
jgi:hypothetical protein